MKNRYLTSIRMKIIVLFILSLVIAGLGANLLLALGYLLKRRTILKEPLGLLSDRFGTLPFLIAAGIVLFICVFFFVAQRTLGYIEELSQTIRRIELGDLDSRIPRRSNDELGDLAESINRMAERMKTSIEDERNAEKTKSELITSLSHDLRTPLTSITGYLGLITNDRNRPEEELRHFAGIAYNKSVRLQKLIEDLFEFTRVSYGGIKPNLTMININGFLEQLVEEFYPVFQQAQLECRISVPDEKLLTPADGDLLARAFENLLNNAVRYGGNGRFIDIELREADNIIFVNVSNYGTEIPAENLPYIFDRFYRVESSRSASTGGTGLGLAIVKSIIGLHGGSITASSGSGKTTFEIQLRKG